MGKRILMAASLALLCAVGNARADCDAEVELSIQGGNDAQSNNATLVPLTAGSTNNTSAREFEDGANESWSREFTYPQCNPTQLTPHWQALSRGGSSSRCLAAKCKCYVAGTSWLSGSGYGTEVKASSNDSGTAGDVLDLTLSALTCANAAGGKRCRVQFTRIDDDGSCANAMTSALQSVHFRLTNP